MLLLLFTGAVIQGARDPASGSPVHPGEPKLKFPLTNYDDEEIALIVSLWFNIR